MKYLKLVTMDTKKLSIFCLLLLITAFIKAQFLVPEYVRNYDPDKPAVYSEDVGGSYHEVTDVDDRDDIPGDKRACGMMVSYIDPGDGWVTERYEGVNTTDTAWENQNNWTRLDDLISSGNVFDTILLGSNILRYSGNYFVFQPATTNTNFFYIGPKSFGAGGINAFTQTTLTEYLPTDYRPTGASMGDLLFDNSEKLLKIFDGTYWQSVDTNVMSLIDQVGDSIKVSGDFLALDTIRLRYITPITGKRFSICWYDSLHDAIYIDSTAAAAKYGLKIRTGPIRYFLDRLNGEMALYKSATEKDYEPNEEPGIFNELIAANELQAKFAFWDRILIFILFVAVNILIADRLRR
jgi:hypothetical protein